MSLCVSACLCVSLRVSVCLRVSLCVSAGVSVRLRASVCLCGSTHPTSESPARSPKLLTPNPTITMQLDLLLFFFGGGGGGP